MIHNIYSKDNNLKQRYRINNVETLKIFSRQINEKQIFIVSDFFIRKYIIIIIIIIFLV